MKITCFGEVLWDLFPDHKKIGGAPLNVALRLNSLGIQASIITKIGNDTLGDDIKKYVKERGLPVHAFQTDEKYKTGQVLVHLDQDHTVTYQISKPVAWDFIEYTALVQKEVQDADAIVYGSLASRHSYTKNTLFRVLEDAKYKILDINLRPPHYDASLLSDLMYTADFIKLNEEELEEICKNLDINSNSSEHQIKEIARVTNTNQLCVTNGGKGAILFYNDTFYYNNGYKIKVVDTVGAGDSFLATLISQLLLDRDPQEAIDLACAMGAMVAGSKGANPIFSEDQIKNFIKKQT